MKQQVMVLYLMFTLLWTGTFLHDWAGPTLGRILSFANAGIEQLQTGGNTCERQSLVDGGAATLSAAVSRAADFSLPLCPCPNHTHSPWIESNNKLKLFDALTMSVWILATLMCLCLANRCADSVSLLRTLLVQFLRRPRAMQLYILKRAILI